MTPSLSTTPSPMSSHLPPGPKSPSGKGFRLPSPSRGGKGRGGWGRGKRGECLQPQWRGHWVNGQLGTLGEMGQSFLDKHGFLSAYKNTTFTYLLAPCPGSWEQMEGGTEERPRGQGRTVRGGGTGSRERGSGPESQKYAAGRLSSLSTYHPSDFYSYFITRSRDLIVLCVLCIILVSYICFVYVLGLNACAMISSIDIYLALTM